jgi:hypothetical protein
MYPWLLVMRVKRCLGRLKNWLGINFPEAEATLRKGASEADIQHLERILKVKLPLPTRILYRFCDGQEFTARQYADATLLGLIGGYSFYEHVVNVYLLPLREVILKTKAVVRHLGFSNKSKYIVVAGSAYASKLFFLNCTTGQLYVGTANLPTDGEMIPCVPKELISSVHDFNGDQQQDAMLLWLEEHGRRLENGIIKLREEENIRSISLFPEEPPLCSTAITNGVKVSQNIWISYFSFSCFYFGMVRKAVKCGGLCILLRHNSMYQIGLHIDPSMGYHVFKVALYEWVQIFKTWYFVKLPCSLLETYTIQHHPPYIFYFFLRAADKCCSPCYVLYDVFYDCLLCNSIH